MKRDRVEVAVWGGIFVGMGALILTNLPPTDSGRFFLIGGGSVFAGLATIAYALFPLTTRRKP